VSLDFRQRQWFTQDNKIPRKEKTMIVAEYKTRENRCRRYANKLGLILKKSRAKKWAIIINKDTCANRRKYFE
jgi:hypothetical protein